jgi:lycopene cyclase domain-containing protein
MELTNFAYLGVLLFIFLGTVWLEFVIGARVLRKPIRLFFSVLPVFIGLVIWDVYAIQSGHWWFNEKFVTGWEIGIVPIEELLFFIIVPIAMIYSFEAVRAVKQWRVGDEA